ncbi:hypothetical protein CDAR_22591 [Caerostris darwini]|uniref:Uncharacterized protein n=1 Tax=Caerostris darwini TaxID=1538125 RepID=A0AAV4V7R7_9ARAC|nr:hypothetical protein CDAR_22591 [Caerostris darwini]
MINIAQAERSQAKNGGNGTTKSLFSSENARESKQWSGELEKWHCVLGSNFALWFNARLTQPFLINGVASTNIFIM